MQLVRSEACLMFSFCKLGIIKGKIHEYGYSLEYESVDEICKNLKLKDMQFISPLLVSCLIGSRDLEN